jgi:hypothetical protein
MPIVRRCFSEALAAAAIAALLAGCGPQARLPQPQLVDTSLEQQPLQTGPAIAQADTNLVPQPAAAEASKPTAEERSHWCRYLREDAAAESTIMRSPSVSGGLSDEGDASVSVGVSMSSFAKADLVEKSANAKCRQYLAEKGIQKLVFTSPQGLTAAGYSAKADAILSKVAEIAELRARANAALARGDIDRAKASSLLLAADQLLADASEARSQADRRLDALSGRPEAVKALSAQLMEAEGELSEINSKMRTYDAVDVSLTGGWRDEIDDNGFDAQRDDFSGKLNFSMKLGAASPQRFEHERAARNARMNAIRSEEGGSLWQIAILRKAHERALAGLADARAAIDSSRREAQKLVQDIESSEDLVMQDALVFAKLKLIQLNADRAAIDGSIKEIEANLARLAG